MPTGDLSRGFLVFLPKDLSGSQLFALLDLLALGHVRGADAKQQS